MTKNINTQKGFIIAVIILIAILVIGGGAYGIYKSNHPGQSSKFVDEYSTTDSELLTILLTSQDPNELQRARDSLAQNAGTETVRVIANTYVKYNTQETGLVRSYLLGTLLRVSSPKAIPGLSEIVNDNPDFSLKTQAAIALGMIGTPDAIQVIVSAINKSTSIALKNVLVESLAAVKNKDSFNDLVKLLNTDTNENIRRAAATALGNISGNSSVVALKNAQQKESSQIVKSAIQSSLNKLEGNANTTSQPIESLIYRNQELHFQVSLPDGSSLSEPSKLGSGGQRFNFQSTKANDLSYFRYLEVEKDVCDKGQSTVINGVPFTRTTDSGYFGGMESGSVDAFYCAMNNGLRYKFAFTITYNRHSENNSPVIVPDQGKSLWQFDQQIQLLNFQFLK